MEFKSILSFGSNHCTTCNSSIFIALQSLLITAFVFTDILHPRKCTVFPFHPLGPVKKREGVVLCVPRSMDDLIQSAQEQLKRPGTFILTENGGRILDADMISDNQKLHLVTDQDMATT